MCVYSFRVKLFIIFTLIEGEEYIIILSQKKCGKF